MFGDFLYPDKHRALTGDGLSCLEDGTPVVARYNARHFQFGIYGNGYVIYQDCQPLTNQVLVFSIKKIPTKEFFRQATAYEYTPDFEYDKRLAFHNAQYNLLLYTTKVILAEEQLFSVFGDDFTLFCMLGDYERFYNAFLSSRVGKHYRYKFFIGPAPAYHHLLAIEEGYAVHFSKGGGNGSPQIIVEDLQTIGRRADTPLINVAYNKEDVISRLLARNRALLVYSGKVSYDSYHLFANNCEHFVHLCKTGHPYSSQVKDFFTDATLVCLSLLARKPHMAAMVLAKRLGWMGVR